MAKKSFWQRGEDYAKKVSGEIIDQIKRGVAPWQKPWKPGEQFSTENFSTGKRYTGKRRANAPRKTQNQNLPYR